MPRKKIGTSIIVNWLAPLVLVIVLRNLFTNDAIPLAIAGAVPVFYTITLLVLRRKVEWIGMLGVLGFILAFIVSVLTGGSSLSFKLYHPLVTGAIGLIFLGSVIIGNPLMLVILKVLKKNGIGKSDIPESRRRATVITVILGLVFIIDAAIHIIMALTLPTVAYLSMSRIVTLIGVIVLVSAAKLVARKRV